MLTHISLRRCAGKDVVESRIHQAVTALQSRLQASPQDFLDPRGLQRVRQHLEERVHAAGLPLNVLHIFFVLEEHALLAAVSHVQFHIESTMPVLVSSAVDTELSYLWTKLHERN